MGGTLLFVLSFLCIANVDANLYPVETESRQVKSLNGLWKFKLSPVNNQNIGFHNKWYQNYFEKLGDFVEMPVPGSFNDVTSNETIRDYVGWVWYQRDFYLPDIVNGSKYFIYFGAVDHNAMIWCNGKQVGEHYGGHVRFDVDISDAVMKKNSLVVAVNNTLTNFTIPQGFYTYPNDTNRYPSGYFLYTHNCDYFDYAGINRNVFLYVVPQNYIVNVEVNPFLSNNNGILVYKVIPSNTLNEDERKCFISIKNFKNDVVAKSTKCEGSLKVANVFPWWPFSHFKNHTPAYLYTLLVDMITDGTRDVAEMQIGFRNVSWNTSRIIINNVPVYIKGFGMHEDSDLHGRGFDNTVMIRDLNLLKWTEANTIRTSHYPYSEEFLQQTDKLGIMVILEVPACSLDNFSNDMFLEHKKYTMEIIAKYKHHPSIIMWSLANEPATNLNISDPYFGNLSFVVKTQDSSRPVTFVTSQHIKEEKSVKHMDVICVNRYSGWYQDPGRLDLVEYQTIQEVSSWHKTYNRPVIITEYGAGAVEGQHSLPSTMWSEDYQVELLKNHFNAFDKLRLKRTLAGEMIWNLIDFNTPQEFIRPGRCMKGIFTRQRQSKSAAHTVRKRYSANLF